MFFSFKFIIRPSNANCCSFIILVLSPSCALPAHLITLIISLSCCTDRLALFNLLLLVVVNDLLFSVLGSSQPALYLLHYVPLSSTFCCSAYLLCPTSCFASGPAALFIFRLDLTFCNIPSGSPSWYPDVPICVASCSAYQGKSLHCLPRSPILGRLGQPVSWRHKQVGHCFFHWRGANRTACCGGFV